MIATALDYLAGATIPVLVAEGHGVGVHNEVLHGLFTASYPSLHPRLC